MCCIERVSKTSPRPTTPSSSRARRRKRWRTKKAQIPRTARDLKRTRSGKISLAWKILPGSCPAGEKKRSQIFLGPLLFLRASRAPENGNRESGNESGLVRRLPFPVFRFSSYRLRPPVLVQIDERDLGLRYAPFGVLRLRPNLDGDGDRSSSDSDEARVERDEVSDVDRCVEHDLAHRHGHDKPPTVTLGLYGGGLVDVREDHSAEDRPVSVRILRHHDDADGGLTIGRVRRYTFHVLRSTKGNFPPQPQRRTSHVERRTPNVVGTSGS